MFPTPQNLKKCETLSRFKMAAMPFGELLFCFLLPSQSASVARSGLQLGPTPSCHAYQVIINSMHASGPPSRVCFLRLNARIHNTCSYSACSASVENTSLVSDAVLLLRSSSIIFGKMFLGHKGRFLSKIGLL